jgi:hypothetical protein
LALLFKQLATLRTDAALFQSVEELRWGGPTAAFPEMATRLGDPKLVERCRRATEETVAEGEKAKGKGNGNIRNGGLGSSRVREKIPLPRERAHRYIFPFPLWSVAGPNHPNHRHEFPFVGRGSAAIPNVLPQRFTGSRRRSGPLPEPARAESGSHSGNG